MSFEQMTSRAQSSWEAFCCHDRPRILVGAATCGRAAGALEVVEAFKAELSKRSLAEAVTLAEVGCNGLCFAEVLVEVKATDARRILYHGVTPAMVPRLVEGHLVKGEPYVPRALAVVEGPELDGVPRLEALPAIENQVRIVLRNCGVIDPTRIDHYVARGGYSGLRRALAMAPEAVIAEISAAGLRGRGGAGFPTGIKWSRARSAPGDEKYVICNADEGDPGAFMNRSLLEGDPYSVLEGLVIAGYAIGARSGYVYVRAEYPLAVARLESALARMTENGLLGRNILGSGFDFSITIKKGAGAFVCGEETALMASIEGRRGMPRSRPPYPAVSGLFGKPTNINNVETLALAAAILQKGAAWFAGFGTEKSKGTKTFALAGKVERTGLIEIPLGLPLSTIVERIGGGVGKRRTFKAVQTGGPSGGCVPAQFLDLPVDYEHLAKVGSIMGSGGMVVMDDESCMVDVARYFLTFTEAESCGKCVPCRMGTQHLLRILTEITQGRGTESHLEELKKIGDTMQKASLCGLGQTAPNPVLTTIKYFEDEYRAHIQEKRCPAGVCRKLIQFSIDRDKCTGCRVCAAACPVASITGEKKVPHAIVQETCIRCGACRRACTFDAVTVR